MTPRSPAPPTPPLADALLGSEVSLPAPLLQDETFPCSRSCVAIGGCRILAAPLTGGFTHTHTHARPQRWTLKDACPHTRMHVCTQATPSSPRPPLTTMAVRGVFPQPRVLSAEEIFSPAENICLCSVSINEWPASQPATNYLKVPAPLLSPESSP